MVEEGDLILWLVGEIYQAALEPGRWPALLESIGDLFGGAAGIMAVLAPPTGPTFAATACLDPALLTTLAQRHADPDTNPTLGRILRLPVGQPAIGAKFHDGQEFLRSAAYNDMLRPQGLQDGAAALLLREPDHVVTWNVMQPAGAEPMGRPEEDLLLVLTPHLRRAAQLLLRLDALRTRADAAEEALDRLPMGVILVGAAGRPIRLNRAAEAIVAEGDGLRVRRDGLVAARPDETRALDRLIADAAATGAGRGIGSGGTLALSRPSGGAPLPVLVAPCRGERLADGRDWPAAVVFVGDPERQTSTPADLLRRLYGLTRAEARLAALLLQGRDLAEAARELEVSLHTVRAHLKAVLAKTGAARQAELVRILLRGPAGLQLV